MSVIPRAVEAKRRRLLFIEDHTELLATYERVFRHHEIVLVETGEEGLETLKRQRDFFDLVICDLVLPGIDGIEVFKRARAADPEMVSRFVFATGSNTRQEFQAELEMIDVPILEKPFGIRMLREMLERAGNSKR